MDTRPESVMAREVASRATEMWPGSPGPWQVVLRLGRSTPVGQEAEEVVAAVSMRSAAAASEAERLIQHLPLGGTGPVGRACQVAAGTDWGSQ